MANLPYGQTSLASLIHGTLLMVLLALLLIFFVLILYDFHCF